MAEQKVALTFPGQGSQKEGMGEDLYANSAAARRLFNEASDVLGFNLTRLCFEGPEEDLRRTINAQPAILTCSWAILQASLELNPQLRGIPPSFVAGHSLGEYTALLAAGVFDFPTAVWLVRKRGELMEEAATEEAGGMWAVIGLAEEALEDICQQTGVVIANYNSPEQFVLSGRKHSLVSAVDLARSQGATKVLPLDVAGAFHSPLMELARQGLKGVLATRSFRDPWIPVVSNVTAQPVIEGGKIKELLALQLVSPVFWRDSISYMCGQGGVSTFLEFGPAPKRPILTGLLKRINRNARGKAINNFESIREFNL